MMNSPLVRKLRKVLLPPESRQELLLRTVYHHLSATRFFINRQQRRAENSYREWRKAQELLPLPNAAERGHPFAVTFLLSIGAGETNAAIQTIQSLKQLHMENWMVIPVVETSDDSDPFAQPRSNNEQIKNSLRLADLTISTLDNLDTEFVLFCTAGDLFQPTLLNYFQVELQEAPTADVYYYDCEFLDPVSADPTPFFKPAAVSPELMLSINYLSRAVIRVSSLVGEEDHVKLENLLAFEYDLLLHLIEKRAFFKHIPRMLGTLQPPTWSLETMINKIICRYYLDHGFEEVEVKVKDGNRSIQWNSGNPSVSLIILNRNHGVWLRSLIESIFTLTDYQNFSVVVVDNRSTEDETLSYYARLKKDERVQVVHYESDFNYSEAINIGVAHSTSEVVVLLNNDMQVVDPGWLRELVQWAMHPGIGVVGAKLLHRNRSIQHAGIILGMNGFIGHLYLNAWEHYRGLAGSADWYRNFYALTGACQAMRRELFNMMGGYDERFRLAFGDIDFCLRVAKTGLRNLYDPRACLVHFEGGSRGYETPVGDILLGYEELRHWLEVDDPYFSPNLTYEPIPACNFNAGAVNDRLANIENRKQALLSALNSEN